MTTASLLQVIGTLAAAAAACGSLASVMQTRRIIRDAALPRPQMELLFVDPPGNLALEVYNSGGGPARAVFALVVLEDRYVMTTVGSFLRPGETTNLGTDFRPRSRQSTACGVLIWRDSSEGVHARSLHGKTARFRKPGGVGVTPDEVWHKFYPELRLDQLTRANTLRRSSLP